MNEENVIREAEVEPAEVNGEEKKSLYSSWRKKINSELVMLLVIGVLFGMAVKTEISKRINIADKNTYAKQGYDLTPKQPAAADQTAPAAQPAPADQAPAAQPAQPQ